MPRGSQARACMREFLPAHCLNLAATIAFLLMLAMGAAAQTRGSATAGILAPPAIASHQDAAGTATQPAGVVWAWGSNASGQLGDGTMTSRVTPGPVSGLIDVVAVSAGWSHSLALRNDGAVWAWGGNGSGQLGTGGTGSHLTPVVVSGLSDVVAVAAGAEHSLAVDSDGAVWAWGGNTLGQLGDGTTTDRSTPVLVNGLTNVVAIAAGNNHCLALRGDGTVRAWGGNGAGQLGDGTTTDRSTPVAVTGLTNVTAVAAGGAHSLALRSDGTLWAWGWNNYGQLGDGTDDNRWTPVAVSGLTNAVAVAAGASHSLALRSDGSVRAWGANYYGQLGDGTQTSSPTPVAVSGLTEIVAVAAGSHSLALRNDGTAWAWGPLETITLTPVAVSGLAKVVAIESGLEHLLALRLPVLLDPITGFLRVGGTEMLTGTGFTAGTVIKLFVATAAGDASHGPYTPESWSTTALTWAVPTDVPLGNGYGSVQVVNPDEGYIQSNVVGALLEGDVADNIPTILYLNGEALGPADPSIGVAHIDTVVAKGSTVTIIGTGFNLTSPPWKPDVTGPAVNLYTATGNVGPLWPMPGATATQLQVVVPVTAPTGPANFQLANSPYTGNIASNAVSAVVGARPTITGVSVVGTTVTVTGTGFCSLSVINLFNLQGSTVVNLGGLSGTVPKVPLAVVSDTQFTFTVPAAAVAGPAFVEVLNPPYIPYASSGNDPDGAFTIP